MSKKRRNKSIKFLNEMRSFVCKRGAPSVEPQYSKKKKNRLQEINRDIKNIDNKYYQQFKKNKR